MPAFIKNHEKSELIAGLITMGAAALLLLGAILVMTQCTASPPGDDPAASTQSPSGPQGPTGPTLEANPYTAGDFAYRNGYLTCLSGESLLGVDVSSHQGSIQWDKVAGKGIAFSMIRIGYRGYEQGNIVEDSHWKTNYQGAKENGLMVGIYFFSQAITVEEAREEATKALQWLDGAALDLPIVFDWEPISDTARTANVKADMLIACALAFCETVENAGYDAMVYFNIDLSTTLLDLLQVQEAGYDFWLAMYKDSMTFPYQIEMWQYTDGGSVDGIDGNVDLNLYFPKSK